MILTVGSSTIETFKTVNFREGLNLILADKSEVSTDKDTRNGVGKTLLIDIIHFCLGGSFEKEGPLARLADRKASFYVVIDVQGHKLTVSRVVRQDSPVAVSGLPDEWLIGLQDQKTIDDYITLKASALNDILGQKWFDLGIHEKFGPTFRGLLAFFARNAKGAFLEPFESFSDMPAWQKQVMNTYLLGLGWEYAVRWQEWKEKSDRFKSAKKAIEGGYLPGFGTIGEMESELQRMKTQHARTKRELDNFRVSEEYDDLKKRVNRLSREMQDRQNANVADGELLRMYHSHLTVEEDTEPENLLRLYEESGVFLGEAVKKHLQEVKQFHKEIVENRRQFLQQEITAIDKRVGERDALNRRDDQEKSQLMGTLSTTGALEEYNKLQSLNSELEGRISATAERIDGLNNLNRTKTALDEDRVELEKQTLNDHIDRRPIRDEAVGVFDEYIHALYECNGDLVIDVEKSGFKFGSKVERDDAEGIGKMKIFCYDLLLSRLWAAKDQGPKFLIHDTTLFDGVEERQRGHALELASNESMSSGFQYISCFNSDFLPDEQYLGKVNVADHIVLRLDDTETGSLLGFRF
jgi:uncharacterized protein YydD (DUF2326 family)